MRFTHLILATMGLGLGVASMATTGCGGDDATTTSASTSTSTTTSSGSSGMTDACTKTAAAACLKNGCLGLVDNSTTMKFGLRMSQLTVTKPSVLGTGVVANVVAKAVEPNYCALTGTATFSWLLDIDLAGKTIRTGGARPAADPNAGFTFVNEMINGKAVAPLNGAITVTGDSFEVAMPTDVIVPIFLDPAASSVVLLPLKKARLYNAKLSTDHNCIGTYDSALAVANKCSLPVFQSGGSLDGYITLADADTVPITTPAESLCVLLGFPADPMDAKKCKDTTQGGDWCSKTNAPADAMCSDSVQLKADFAASSVKING